MLELMSLGAQTAIITDKAIKDTVNEVAKVSTVITVVAGVVIAGAVIAAAVTLYNENSNERCGLAD